MPRNSSGVYSLPNATVGPVGAVIDPVDENQTRSDMASELTNSLDRNGRGSMLASLKLFDGSVAAPGLTWGSDTDNGLFRNGTNDWSMSAGATEVARLTANQFQIPATATLSVLGTLAALFGELRAKTISPAQLVANTNDWAPTGLATAGMIRVSTDASRNLTGLTGGTDGRIISIHNIGAQPLVLTDEGSGSAAANRFALLFDLTLSPDEVVNLQYDGTSLRWRLSRFQPSAYWQGILKSDATGILNTSFTAKGSIISATAANTPSEVTVGADGTVLTANSAAAAGVSYSVGFTTGDVKATIKTVADTGWVMMNDGSIGDATSGGTTRANADTVALFTLLWNNTTNAECPVSTGRGASAAADFAAHKNITLPKALGRALVSAGAGAGLTARTLAAVAGTENAVLVAHSHGGATGGQSADHSHDTQADQVGGVSSVGGGQTIIYQRGFGTPFSTAGSSNDHSHSISPEGVSGTGQNIQPSVFLNFMIKL